MKYVCELHQFLVVVVYLLFINVVQVVETRSLKSVRSFREGLQHRGQWETLNGASASTDDPDASEEVKPSLTQLDGQEDDGADVEDGGVADDQDKDVFDDDAKASADDVEKEAAAEEEQDAVEQAALEKDEKDEEADAKKGDDQKAETQKSQADEDKAERQKQEAIEKAKKKDDGDKHGKAGTAKGEGSSELPRDRAKRCAKGDCSIEGEEQAQVTPEMFTSTPLPQPFSYMYDQADAVARDVELRRGVGFHPQGTKPEIDMTKQEQFKTDSFFSQDPSIFGHCVLIRDFAEPLRVGSALMRATNFLEKNTGNHLRGKGHQHLHPKAPPHWHAKSSHAATAAYANSSHAVSHQLPKNFARSFASGSHYSVHHRDVDGRDTDGRAGKEKTLPHEALAPKGGVVDRDTVETIGADGSVEDDVELEVNMFAFLRSVAGEVAVIANGDIAKWSSKKKVPIAGYLCTTDDGPVLHTLPTPCLPTSLDENGQPFTPPQPPPMYPSQYHVPRKPDGSPAAAPSAAPVKPVKPVKVVDPEDALEAEAEKEAEEAESVANGPTKASMLQTAASMKWTSAPAPAQAPGPSPAAPKPDDQMPPLPTKPLYEPFHVWVGTTLLEFRSKPKAERFCQRLTKRIAEDIGDSEWDADRLLPETVDKKDMSVANFMALSRKKTAEWTTGTKKLLVVVMDWMQGDMSKAPFTEQTKTPRHYEQNIFPKVRQAFQRMSHGKFDVAVTVVPEVVRFTKPRSRYTAGGYPFPGLYNGAKDSIEGSWKFGNQYAFGDFDLVYVISPQQAPTGTKGVAWVGAKGAMCNGCEAISENFQVMVAVHELGHNLGLWHASSKSLEYGNVFDWMGNYPDVTGLSYGLGYKLRLHWLPEASVAKITETDMPSLNDEYHLMAFDNSVGPVSGQLAGVQIDLKGNRRYLYVSYRKEPATGRAGIFLTMQDRDKPNSELIDCACHSPSQQDAALRQGWTYIDPTGEVVIHAYKVDDNVATVRIYKAPSASKVAAIKARNGFTDGQWKCPRVCTDADLLVSLYKGCGMLAQDGYCKGGSITMSGKKFSVGTELCPKSCDQCAAATSGGSISSSGCADKNVKISGMNCMQVAGKGYCDYSTNIGHIGDDLCPSSCGRCPAKPTAPSSSSGGFTDPKPVRTHGMKTVKAGTPQAPTETEQDRDNARAEQERAEEEADDTKEQEDEKEAEGSGKSWRDTCTDDSVWTDADGDGCAVYGQYIKDGKLNKEEACNYGASAAKNYCRATCGTCFANIDSNAETATCEDKQCVTRWRYERGKCFACNEWSNSCNLDHFAHDCPRTCGLCQATEEQTTPPLPTTPMPTTTKAVTMPPTEAPTKPPKCEDSQCVESWLKSFNVCHQCADFAEDYCGRDELFMQSCPKSCRICVDGEAACHDDFLPHTCKRYATWGWCSQAHIQDHCQASCGLCSLEIATGEDENKLDMPTLFPRAASHRASPPLIAFIAAVLCATTLGRL